MSTAQQTETQTEAEKVHLGTDCYHSDRGGLPGCVELVWRSVLEESTREEAERKGYAPCGRCVKD